MAPKTRVTVTIESDEGVDAELLALLQRLSVREDPQFCAGIRKDGLPCKWRVPRGWVADPPSTQFFCRHHKNQQPE